MTAAFELCSRAVDELAAQNPDLAAELGVASEPGRWGDYSPDGMAAQRALAERLLGEARAIETDDPADLVALRVLIDEMEAETFEAVIDANVTQSWLMARAATRQMKAQGDGGKIVLMSSARGLLGHPAGYTAYCASKAAVDGITKALGCELGPTGITVNAIAPTVFRSPLTAWMFGDDDHAKTVRNGFLARVPKGRLGEPEDLAGPLLFLSSKASDFYTGHILYADGGYTAG